MLPKDAKVMTITGSAMWYSISTNSCQLFAYSMPGVFVPMIGKMRKTTQSRYIRTRAMI